MVHELASEMAFRGREAKASSFAGLALDQRSSWCSKDRFGITPCIEMQPTAAGATADQAARLVLAPSRWQVVVPIIATHLLDAAEAVNDYGSRSTLTLKRRTKTVEPDSLCFQGCHGRFINC